MTPKLSPIRAAVPAEQGRLHRAEVLERLYEEGRMVAAEWTERRRARFELS